MKAIFIGAVSALAAILFSGCALTTARVSLHYTPQTNVVAVAGAEKVSVNVAVDDSRLIRDKVSAKKNGYGVEMAPIVADEDVTEVVKHAIESELSNRRFKPGDGDVSLEIDLSKFYNDFKMGFFAGDAVAEVIMEARIKDAAGHIVYSRLVSADGRERNIQLASGANAKIALEAALKNAVTALFDDPAFVHDLLKASKK
ncbi:MAG TPA: YajG family lipoprotein [Verrucomicrobiae bacterium]|nr:YajG family lipoprotein [Verrucomicrobiae bacterium]